MTGTFASPGEKVDVMEAEIVSPSDRSGKEGLLHDHGVAAKLPGTTLDSFSHLDEKKILQKASHPVH